MGGFHWFTEHWEQLLNAIGIIGGLFFTGFALHANAKAQRVANLLSITASHRDIWKQSLHRPELRRILNASADLIKRPLSQEEIMFVTMVIHHLSSVHEAMTDQLIPKLEGLRRDVWSFFSLPIPQAVWEKAKVLQNTSFVAFVEECRNWK